MSANELQKKFYFLLITLFISGCSNFPSLQTPYNDRNPLIDGPIKVENPQPDEPLLSSQGYRFSASYKEAKTSPTPANLRKFLESGMTYTDLQCSDYFSRIDWTRAQRDYAQKQTTLAGSLTTAMLGLADAGSAATGAVGSAFGFTSSSFDAYNTAFLASTDIGLLQELVASAQVQDKREILKRVTATSGSWPDRIDSLDLAVSDLNTYISRCTPTGIRNLLKASIQEKTKQQITESTKAPAFGERLSLSPSQGNETQPPAAGQQTSTQLKK
ncbi:hypothetical protein [Pseudomonas sp. Pseusp97]|uniref:hypothetical protein n=1 Tax=Pseudomonas sp. Pseusp97 TaxID=3243065 RepID=UPI0039A74AEC